jgi:2-polyprenyl-3-methyl-5-hydroxy-6-metoxy-1,4-benzoquinol methylase
MKTEDKFKDHLYDNYLSSGQAKDNSGKQNPFKENAPYVESLIKKHFPNKDHKIVDLGCGSGMYLYFLQKNGYMNSYGCDISEEQVKSAQSMGIQNIAKESVDTYVTNISEKADAFLLIDIIEHLPSDVTFDLIKSIHGKLNNGGKVIVHVPNGEGIFGMKIRYGDYTHETAFTTTSLRQIFKSLGFSDIRFYEDKPIIYSPTSLVRRILWDVLTLPYRLLNLAESGNRKSILSRNILAVATR